MLSEFLPVQLLRYGSIVLDINLLVTRRQRLCGLGIIGTLQFLPGRLAGSLLRCLRSP